MQHILFRRDGIIKDENGSWIITTRNLLMPSITVKANAEQMLWLSQYPRFSTILCDLQDRFGCAIEIQQFFALEVALNIGACRDNLGSWLEAVDDFIYKLECFLLKGEIV